MEPADRQIVQVDVSPSDAELTADALWQAGPSAVSEVALPNGMVRLTADVESPDAVAGGWPIEVLRIDGDAFLDAWRAYARPSRAGRRLVIQPPWVDHDEVEGHDIVLLVDPGRSFGSGSHPATRLALAALEDHVRAGDRVVDVGCGSGILAIASLLLGAAEVEAVDVDPVAIEATQENAARNGVGTALIARQGSAEVVSGQGDVVVANIGVAVLRDLGPALVALARPGGHLVLSGLLEGQVVEAAAAMPGCNETERYREGDWVAPVLRRLS